MDHKQLTNAFIGGLILNLVRADLAIKPIRLIEAVKFKFEYTISYWKTWHAKQHALRFLFGDWKEAYNLLPELMNAIVTTNHGTQYHLWTGATDDASNTEFEGLFWAFGQSLNGFYRPVITVDGTFLTGKYQGCLLMAVATDANNQLFSLAFALVEIEKNETWGWFFQCLRAVIGTREGLCIILDRHAGILHAMRDHRFGWSEPNSYHRYCCDIFRQILIPNVPTKY